MLKVSKCSSTWFNPCGGRWQVPVCSWQSYRSWFWKSSKNNELKWKQNPSHPHINSSSKTRQNVSNSDRDFGGWCLQSSVVLCLVIQSYLTLCDPMDCSPPGPSVHGILQAKILEWGYHDLLQGIFPTQESNQGLLHCRQIPVFIGALFIVVKT